MNIKELRASTGMTQSEFGKYFNIPMRTIQNWEGGKRNCPKYLAELIEYKLEKENNKMKNNFKILEVREQNPYADPMKANNGGGYSQPLITFVFNGTTGYIDDSSCGDFGERIHIEYKDKSYCVDAVGREKEEYSSFSKNCLEDNLLSERLKEAGYPISFSEDLSN